MDTVVKIRVRINIFELKVYISKGNLKVFLSNFFEMNNVRTNIDCVSVHDIRGDNVPTQIR